MNKALHPARGGVLTRRQAIRKSVLTTAGIALAPNFLSATRPAHLPVSIITVRPEADDAAQFALRHGGNAVDAAVAAMMALCVVQPSSVGFGGYGGSMAIYLARKRRVTAIDFDSRAPMELRPDLLPDTRTATHGYLSVGVPGIVAGFDLALRNHGKLPWRVVAEPALRLAEDGIVVDGRLSKSLAALAQQTDPVSLKAYFPSGSLPQVGERWVQKDLARLIGTLGRDGAAAFYHGDIAKAIVRQVRAQGGVLSEKDFRRFKAQEIEPTRTTYRGYDLFTPPPPSGGLTSLCILRTLEQFDLASTEPWGPDYFHWFAQAAKLCWAERFKQFGDPEVTRFSTRELLSTEAAAARAQRIRERKVALVTPPGPAPLHTCSVVVIDGEGNAVALTATHGGGYGSHVVIDGLGLVLGHGISRFDLAPGSPNAPGPGKRMQHNMAPLIALRDGRLAHVIALPGGRMIVTVTAQLAASVINFKADAAQAVSAPRVHTEGNEPLTLSPNASASLVSGLEQRGHTTSLAAVAGPANVAIVDPATGQIDAASGRHLITS
jgi:gamma-glutamyltranspeptidase/glutathione hydrolase